MRKITTILLILFTSLLAEVISEDTTWDINNSPYTILENTVIMDGATLTIDPAVTVLFGQDVSLRVLMGGALIAEGTVNDSITFTVSDIDDIANVEGIIFESGSVNSNFNGEQFYSGSLFNYCIFKDIPGKMLSIEETDLFINNSKFINNTSNNGIIRLNTSSGNPAGPDAEGVSLYIINTDFTSNISTNNAGVVYGTYSSSVFNSCNFDSNYSSNNGGVVFLNQASVNFISCSVSHNIANGNGGVVSSETPSGSNGFYSFDTIFNDNYSGGSGGVFYNNSYSNQLTIEDTYFIRNIAQGSGGVSYSTCSGLCSNGINSNNSVYIENQANGAGAVFSAYMDNPEWNIDWNYPALSIHGANNIFYKNSHNGNSSTSGSIIDASIGNVYDSALQIFLSSSLFIDNFTAYPTNSSEISGFFRSGDGAWNGEEDFIDSNQNGYYDEGEDFTDQGTNNAFYGFNGEFISKYFSGGTATIDFVDNYWGTKSSTVIDSLIYDFYDDLEFNTYVVNYSPFLLAPRDELVGSPSSITGLSLKTDDSYQVELIDNINPGDSLFIELEGIDSESLSKGLTVAQVINPIIQDTVLITLVESSEDSGLYRGIAYTGEETDNINNIIQGQDGEVLKIISRISSDQQIILPVGDAVTGCMDSSACNYNSYAIVDDGSCFYPEGTCGCDGYPLEGYCGCNSQIFDDCGECEGNDWDQCDDDLDTIVNIDDSCPDDAENDGDGDGICGNDEILGCQDPLACNYNENATDEGGCMYVDGICETCSGENDGTGVIVDNDTDDDTVCDDEDMCPEEDDLLDENNDEISDCLCNWNLPISNFICYYIDLPIIDKYDGDTCIDTYKQPSPNELNQFRCHIQAFLYDPDLYNPNNSYDCDVTLAGLGYEITNYNDYKIFYEINSHPVFEKGWGTYIYNPNAERQDLIIEVNHPDADDKTEWIGVNLFDSYSEAGWVLIAGAHRWACYEDYQGNIEDCLLSNGNWSNSCESDMARQQGSVFQAFHEEISNYHYGDIYALSIHSFDEDNYDTNIWRTDVEVLTEVGIVISNGYDADEDIIPSPLFMHTLVAEFNALSSSLPYVQTAISVSDGLDYNFENFLQLKASLNPQGTFSNTIYSQLGPRWFHIEADGYMKGINDGRDEYYRAIENSLDALYNSNVNQYQCPNQDIGTCHISYCNGVDDSGAIYDNGVCSCLDEDCAGVCGGDSAS